MLSRIFDPFFSTKEIGHGLGLATCHSIINRHRGAIDVSSVIDNGTTFHVYLPATEDLSSFVNKQDIRHQGRGKIIVMDDENVIRETITPMLEALGYAVECRSDGKAAIDLFIEEYRAHRCVSAMILDLTVPGGTGGKDVAREIRKFDPHISLFVSSGYSDDPVMEHPAGYSFTASLCKPLGQLELVELLEKHMKT